MAYAKGHGKLINGNYCRITTFAGKTQTLSNLPALVAPYDSPALPWWQANGYTSPVTEADLIPRLEDCHVIVLTRQGRSPGAARILATHARRAPGRAIPE